MRTKEEILADEKMLINMKCPSGTIHTELLLDIRKLLIDINKKWNKKD